MIALSLAPPIATRRLPGALGRVGLHRHRIEDEVLSDLTAEEKATLRRLLTQALEGARVPADSQKH